MPPLKSTKKVNNQKNNKDWKSMQRERAVELYNKGWKQTQIAEALNVTQGCISLWIKKAKENGLESLKTKYSPGAPSKLTSEQKQQLFEMLKKGPKAFNFSGDSWRYKQIVELIRVEFGVVYDPSQISRILKSIAWNKKSKIRTDKEVTIESSNEGYDCSPIFSTLIN